MLQKKMKELPKFSKSYIGRIELPFSLTRYTAIIFDNNHKIMYNVFGSRF